MRKIIIGLLALGIVCTVAWVGLLKAADDAAPAATPAASDAAPPAASAATPAPVAEAPAAAPAAATPAPAAAAAPAGGTMTPVERSESTPKGQLHNPYNNRIAETAEAGHAAFQSNGCSGCHGGNGGGGMGAVLTNKNWVYGSEDDVLFRLVSFGSLDLRKQGFPRKSPEVEAAVMPKQSVKSDDEVWKILAWVRSINPSSLKQVDIDATGGGAPAAAAAPAGAPADAAAPAGAAATPTPATPPAAPAQ